MLGAIIHLCIFALVCLLIWYVVEWIAGLFGLPAKILMVIRAIIGLIILLYLLGLLLGWPNASPRWLTAPPGG